MQIIFLIWTEELIRSSNITSAFQTNEGTLLNTTEIKRTTRIYCLDSVQKSF